MEVAAFRACMRKRMEKARIKAIETGARTRFVHYHRETGKIIHSLDGLTRRLRERFYPHEPERMSRKRRRALGLIGGGGAKEGTKTHQWVRHLINCTQECSCPHKPKGTPTLHARSFLADARKLGYTPLHAELPVWSLKKNLMTLLDVVLRTPDGRVAVVELKTGFNGSIDGADKATKNRYLHGPAFPKGNDASLNTFRHKHYLQALAGAFLYNLAHDTTKTGEASEAWVVYLNDVHRKDAHKAEKTQTSWYAAHQSDWVRNGSQIKTIFDYL